LNSLGFFIFRWGKGDKDVKKEIKKTRMGILDFSEKKVLRKIKNRNTGPFSKSYFKIDKTCIGC